MKFIFAMSLLFLFKSLTSQASSLEFNEYAYSAIDSLKNDKSTKKYAKAMSLLSLARNSTKIQESKDLILNAMSVLEGGVKPNSPLPTNQSVALAISFIGNSLHYQRIRLGVQSGFESELLEGLIKEYFFPGMSEKVGLVFDGIEKDEAISLIATYFADPRAANYDPEVSALMTGKKLDGSDSQMIVRFVLPEQTFEIPGDQDPKTVEGTLKNQINSLLSRELPIRAEVKARGNYFTLKIEVLGIKNAPLVETFLQMVLAPAGPNRYLFSAANGFEWIGKQLSIGYWLGNSSIQEGAKNLAGLAFKAEDILRSKIFAGNIWEPSPNKIIEKIKKGALFDQEHMILNLKKDLARLEGHVSERVISERKAKTQQWIENSKKQTELKIKNVIDALRAVANTNEYKLLRPSSRNMLLLATAEKVSGIKVLTIDRTFLGLSFLLAGYYSLEGVIQLSRAKDPVTQLEIRKNYGAKIINALVYAVPVLREGAVAIDVGSLTLNKVILPILESDIEAPNTEALLHKLFDLTENLGALSGGSSQIQLKITAAEELYNITPLSKNNSGFVTNFEMLKFQHFSRLHKFKKIDDKAFHRARTDFRNANRKMTQSYVSLILVLLNQSEGRYNSQINDYIETLNMLITDPKTGYLLQASQLLAK